MVGYFPPLMEGELVYGSTRRAILASFGEVSPKTAAARLLGARDKTFGLLLPNNGRALLERIPAIAGIDEEALLGGSIYHILAPFLEDAARLRLRDSIFAAPPKGLRGDLRQCKHADSGRRYCRACSDPTSGRFAPEIWRVVDNFPGVNCCHLHGSLLTGLGDISTLPALSQDAGPPASEADWQYARDVAAIYRLRSSLLPGGGRIAFVLRRALLPRWATRRNVTKLDAARIGAELQRCMPKTLARLDPTISRVRNTPLLRVGYQHSVARYLLLSQLSAATQTQPGRAGSKPATLRG